MSQPAVHITRTGVQALVQHTQGNLDGSIPLAPLGGSEDLAVEPPPDPGGEILLEKLDSLKTRQERAKFIDWLTEGNVRRLAVALSERSFANRRQS